MPQLQAFRRGRPGFYPDQAIYAEYACARLGLSFRELDGGTGLLFGIASASREICFGGGRCSYYPQNDATASSLATDKYLANALLQRAGLATLGGRYFFLHERHRALRPPGHERGDAQDYLEALGGRAFAKPLTGSRGDFARPIASAAALTSYLDEVARSYDSVLIQPIASGHEYRVFVVDGEALYTARKRPPFVIGDGVHSLRDLLRDHDRALRERGLSDAATDDAAFDTVPADGELREIEGRMNLSAGGAMTMEGAGARAIAAATAAVRALGLRLGAVDLFVDPERRDVVQVIEVNSNPAIRFLESCGRDDLILAIWRHTFTTTGLL
ncbi:ATP-grasp domain-containing protein [Rhodopseudomonas sp. NSM]|uniref:ATP-grasp domain-containing protein n=1 Tax=Rhodopseudomonas sp. NSM TaxID=3457630 RepID=UPI0040350821